MRSAACSDIQAMPQRAPVADYLGALTRQLSFDRPLAHRVRQEVEDHLWEAAAANCDSSIEAQARAVRCFGEAREIASQYAALSLLRQARRSGAIIVLASGALYIAMRGRVAWYGLMQWALSDAMQPVGKVVLAIDRTAYILAFMLGAVGWAYISSRRVSPRSTRFVARSSSAACCSRRRRRVRWSSRSSRMPW
jgi:hypothetical protein